MELRVTVPQEVVQNFLKRHSEWDGDEETRPSLCLGNENASYNADTHFLAEDAILVGIPLQHYLVALVHRNNNPYEVWFVLIRNSKGIWEQGKGTKEVTFEESMELIESQGYHRLLEELRAS